MAFKNATIVLTQDQFKKATPEEVASWVGSNISVERAKKVLTQLINDGVVKIDDPKMLYDLTYGRVMVEGTILVEAKEKKPVGAPKGKVSTAGIAPGGKKSVPKAAIPPMEMPKAAAATVA